MESKEKTTAIVTTSQSNGIDFTDVSQFEQLQRACQIFTHSALVPKMYQESQTNPAKNAIANVMIAMDMAKRIGASVLMVMQNLYIVNSKPSWASQFLIATINTCGRFEPLKYRFNKQKTECTAYTTEKGSDVVLEGTTITLDMAKAEGWYDKPGSKWKTMPQQMLIYRAAAFWIRTYAPEISMGIHTAEENYDIADAEVVNDDVMEKVEKEISDFANKEEISMDAELPQEEVVSEPPYMSDDDEDAFLSPEK